MLQRTPGMALAVLKRYGQQDGGEGEGAKSPDDEEEYTPKHLLMHQFMKAMREDDVRAAVKHYDMLAQHSKSGTEPDADGDYDGDDDDSDE